MTTHHSHHSSRPRSERRQPSKRRADDAPAQQGSRGPAKREGGLAAEDGRLYGSGGSYGYGGAFQHGGQRGYDVSFAERDDAGGSETEEDEERGKFGHDTEGYSRQGIGHPGKEEKRPRAERTEGTPAPSHPPAEDARKGYSQESGYAQSGGNPTPGGSRERSSKRSS